jgi:hypothetical protein
VMFAVSVSIVLLVLLAGCSRPGSRMANAPNAELESSNDSVHEFTQTLAANDEPPRLLIEHNLGLMNPFQTTAHDFLVTNPSQSPWHLSEIRNPCACTVISHSSNVIRPQEAETFEVQFTASTDRPGPKYSAVTLVFDGAPGAEVTLQVRANIRNTLEISPGYLRFTVTDETGPASQLLTVENYGNEIWSSP